MGVWRKECEDPSTALGSAIGDWRPAASKRKRRTRTDLHKNRTYLVIASGAELPNNHDVEEEKHHPPVGTWALIRFRID